MIKNLAEVRTINLEDVDTILLTLTPGGERQSATFVNWSLGKAGQPSQQDMQDMMDLLPEKAEDSRPSRQYKVKGHLFDKGVINRLLDAVVDSPCEFKVTKMHVAPVNRRHSMATLQVLSWGAGRGHGLTAS